MENINPEVRIKLEELLACDPLKSGFKLVKHKNKNKKTRGLCAATIYKKMFGKNLGLRITMEVDKSIKEDLLNTIYDIMIDLDFQRERFGSQTLYMQMAKQISEDSFIDDMVAKIPFPLNNRRFVSVRAREKISDTKIIVAAHSCDIPEDYSPPVLRKKSGKVRKQKKVTMGAMEYMFEWEDCGDKMVLNGIQIFGLAGKIPKKIISWSAKQSTRELYDMVEGMMIYPGLGKTTSSTCASIEIDDEEEGEDAKVEDEESDSDEEEE
eukprot:TRINITY_DN775911_c0_g1_i1.p1 TRINITY_DN775911_c0_g1~~TRINITY_DN775911_c0_g1_i1.p1  ORF type:complete len:266 (+),score=93.02 TRINITY_DN775911_c0_g1_i1:79-876(+)